ARHDRQRIALPPAILDEYWRLHPVEASRVGVAEYDAALPDFSEAGLDARREWRTRAGAEVATLNALDARVLQGELVGDAIDDDFQLPRRAPYLYVEQAMQSLHILLSRRTSPEIRARLDGIPRLL